MIRTLTKTALVGVAIFTFASSSFAQPRQFNAQIPPQSGEPIDPSAYETVMDGKKVGLYTISNGKITAQITNYGAHIVGLFTPDKNGVYKNIVGSRESIEAFNARGGNPVGSALGRFANRISNGTFSIDGTTYEVTKNLGQHTLHGGNSTFEKTVWDIESVSKNEVVMSCVLPDGLDGFPGTFKTYLTFSITDDDALMLNFKSTTDKPTVCNLSHHVYFNLNGFDGSPITDHILQINSDKILEVDSALIPSGNFINVKGTPFDFNEPVRIGDRQDRSGVSSSTPGPFEPDSKVRSFDNCFCVYHISKEAVEKIAEIYSPDSGIKMEVLNNHPGLQVYTGGRNAIALESQMYPDSPNRPEFPSTVLRPGETYNHTVVYRLSVK